MLWATTPGRVNWTGGFIYGIAITAAIPILLLVASFFPEVTGSLTGLIESLHIIAQLIRSTGAGRPLPTTGAPIVGRIVRRDTAD